MVLVLVNVLESPGVSTRSYITFWLGEELKIKLGAGGFFIYKIASVLYNGGRTSSRQGGFTLLYPIGIVHIAYAAGGLRGVRVKAYALGQVKAVVHDAAYLFIFI